MNSNEVYDIIKDISSEACEKMKKDIDQMLGI